MDNRLAQILGQAHARLSAGDTTGAWTMLEPELARHPREPKLLQLAGMVRRDAGDVSAARSLFEASETAGGGGEVANMLGNLLAELGDTAGAEAAFARSIAANPRDANPLINRGRMRSTLERHDEALADLRRAVALAPRSVIAAVALGNALRLYGEPVDAVAELRRAQSLDPARTTTALHLGVAMIDAREPDGAFAVLDRARTAGDRSPALLHNRAAAILAAGDIGGARAAFDELIALHPTYLDGQRARARLIQEYALDEDPFGGLRSLTAAFPSEFQAWQAWLHALLSARRYDDVLETAEAAGQALGDHPEFAWARAVARSESGLSIGADTDFATAATSLSDRADFQTSLARHFLKQGCPDRAVTACEAAIAIDPSDQLAWAYLGSSWRILGDAREHWLHDYERHVAIMDVVPPGDPRDPARFAADCAETLRALHVTRAHPVDQSLRAGTQTVGALFGGSDRVLGEIEAAVRAAVARFIAGLPVDHDHPFLGRARERFRFIGSWSVRLTQSGFHINHVHPRGWISSACYFALPERTGDEGSLALGEPPAELALDHPPRRIIRPEPGRLVLFPSSMWHGTIPFASEGERLTVAFDVVPA